MGGPEQGGEGGQGRADVLRGGPARHHHAAGPGDPQTKYPDDDRQFARLWPGSSELYSRSR